MRSYKVISADSHVYSAPDTYTKRFPRNLRDKAPHIEQGPKQDFWVYDGKRVPYAGSVAGVRYQDWAKVPRTVAQTKHNGFDPVERIQDQDLDGLDGEVLYSGIVGGFAAGDIEDLDVRLATIRAYNDWLVDYCSYAPDRLFGMAVLPLWEIEMGLTELHRTVKAGMRGAMIAMNDDKPFTLPEWDILWSAFEELDVPVALHLASTVGRGTHRLGDPGVNSIAWVSADAFPLAEPIAAMIVSGVFERHPKLRLIPAESQAAWWGYFLQRMDDVWKRWRYKTNNTLPQWPSFYFHRNIFTTFQEDLLAMRIKDLIGVDNMMWASDYPHSATTWGRSQDVLAEHGKMLTPVEQRKVFCENALRVYGISG